MYYSHIYTGCAKIKKKIIPAPKGYSVEVAGVNRNCGVVTFSAMCYPGMCSVPCGIFMLGYFSTP